jgi:hypothetical protein
LEVAGPDHRHQQRIAVSFRYRLSQLAARKTPAAPALVRLEIGLRPLVSRRGDLLEQRKVVGHRHVARDSRLGRCLRQRGQGRCERGQGDKGSQ